MDGVLFLLVLIAIILTVIVIYYASIGNSNSQETMESIAKFSFPIYIVNLERKPERYQYVSAQLETMGITNYQRWLAVDGFKTDKTDILKQGVTEGLYNKGKGLAGCAASHVSLWKHLVDTKADWTLILEDDANFHPEFLKLFPKFWNQVPKRAKIIYPGHCCGEEAEKKQARSVIETSVMCTHAYIINWQGAKYLLDKLTPMKRSIDIEMVEHFRAHGGSFIFNGHVVTEGIRPNDYKEQNGNKCMFNGLIYQN